MSTRLTRITLSLLACAASLAAVSTQASAAMSQAPSITVNASDLNLATDSGVAALHARIRLAAEHVCGDYDARDLSAANQAAKCQKMAMDGVAPRIALAIETAQSVQHQAANTAQPEVSMR